MNFPCFDLRQPGALEISKALGRCIWIVDCLSLQPREVLDNIDVSSFREYLIEVCETLDIIMLSSLRTAGAVLAQAKLAEKKLRERLERFRRYSTFLTYRGMW